LDLSLGEDERPRQVATQVIIPPVTQVALPLRETLIPSWVSDSDDVLGRYGLGTVGRIAKKIDYGDWSTLQDFPHRMGASLFRVRAHLHGDHRTRQCSMKEHLLSACAIIMLIFGQSQEIDSAFGGVDMRELDSHPKLAAPRWTHYRCPEFPVRDQASHGLTDFKTQSLWRVGNVELHPLSIGDLRARQPRACTIGETDSPLYQGSGAVLQLYESEQEEWGAVYQGRDTRVLFDL